MSNHQISGILLLDKPLGLSSNQILQKVKHLFKAKKAGHTGSLDPLATGMLPICFGEATKFSQYLLDADKIYTAHAKLGIKTETGDKEGKIISQREVPSLSQEEVQKILQQFLGESSQIPPMYSALKQDGKPLYQLAREGKEVARAARTIFISSLNLNSLAKDEFSITVHCSKGTYIRTLIEDMGEKIGCGAHVSYLRRDSVAQFQSQAMFPLEELQAKKHEDLLKLLIPIDSSLLYLPKIILSDDETTKIFHGKQFTPQQDSVMGLNRLYHQDNFIGIGEVIEGNVLKVSRLVNMNDFEG